MDNQKLLAHQTKREEIEKEFDAIEAGAFALVTMLRTIKQCAVELHNSSFGGDKLAPEALETLTRLRDTDAAELARCRVIIGEMLEDVGNFLDGSDMDDERSVSLTAPVYELFHSFPPAPIREAKADPGQGRCEHGTDMGMDCQACDEGGKLPPDMRRGAQGKEGAA